MNIEGRRQKQCWWQSWAKCWQDNPVEGKQTPDNSQATWAGRWGSRPTGKIDQHQSEIRRSPKRVVNGQGSKLPSVLVFNKKSCCQPAKYQRTVYARCFIMGYRYMYTCILTSKVDSCSLRLHHCGSSLCFLQHGSCLFFILSHEASSQQKYQELLVPVLFCPGLKCSCGPCPSALPPQPELWVD